MLDFIIESDLTLDFVIYRSRSFSIDCFSSCILVSSCFISFPSLRALLRSSFKIHSDCSSFLQQSRSRCISSTLTVSVTSRLGFAGSPEVVMAVSMEVFSPVVSFHNMGSSCLLPLEKYLN